MTQPVPVPIVKLLTWRLEVIIVEAVSELVNIAKLEIVLGRLVKPPPPPIVPYAVDKDEIAAVIEEFIDAVLTYRKVPRPITVDLRSLDVTPPPPNTTPVILLTSSVRVLMDFVISCCVDT